MADKAKDNLKSLADLILGEDPTKKAASNTARAIGLGERSASRTQSSMESSIRGIERVGRQMEASSDAGAKERKDKVANDMATWIAAIQSEGTPESVGTPLDAEVAKEGAEGYLTNLEQGRTGSGILRPRGRAGEAPFPEYKLNVPESVAQDTEFMTKVDRLAGIHGVDKDEILKVIQFETAGSWDPAQKAGTSSATGLIQFMPDTAKELGTSTSALAKMSRSEQMDYVEKYLARFEGKLKSFDDLYMAIHWPAAVGKEDSYTLYSSGSKAYKANKGLDINKDGKVTRGEAVYRARS